MLEQGHHRIENFEGKLPHYVQVYTWEKTVQFTEALLPTIADVGLLTDLLTVVEISAGNAGRQGDKEWEERLYSQKYKLLVRAAGMRKEGHPIVIRRKGIKHTNVIFIFDTKPETYVTRTRLSNLQMVEDEDRLNDLLFPYDNRNLIYWTSRLKQPEKAA